MKWSVGRPRPEEIAMQIANNIITEADGVPGDVVTAVKDMELTHAEAFTHYAEGSPLHPSWPAMHSASSAASLWLAVVADLTADQYCQALRTDYAVSFARTVAGVHYTTDNIAGLNLGQKVLADKIAAHLSEKYGADPQAVQQKVDSLVFDWNTFDPVTCTVGNS
jgi:membrane-associated phospholipid phosphatase